MEGPKILILYSEYERFLKMEEELRSLQKELKVMKESHGTNKLVEKTEMMTGSGSEEGTFSLPLPLHVDEEPSQSISKLTTLVKSDPFDPAKVDEEKAEEKEESTPAAKKKKVDTMWFYIGD